MSLQETFFFFLTASWLPPLLLLLLLQGGTVASVHLTPDNYAPCTYNNGGPVKILDCTSKGLTEVPGVDPAMAVAAFYLDNNAIPTIGSRAFVNLSGTLNFLSIKSTTLMDRIDSTAFAGLTALKSLTVAAKDGSQTSMNKVQIGNLLSGLGSLTSLSMTQVNINELPISFAGTTSLQDLALVRTAIATINSHAFSNASQLRSLDLSQNNALGAGSGSVSWLGPATSLEKCVLDSCDITTSYLGQIPSLPRLKQLSLRNNKLDRLMITALENVADTLEDLVLSGNSISESNTDGLAGLVALKKLTMVSNPQLSAIPSQVSQLPGLELLDLRETRISGVHANSFHPSSSLRTLKLDYTRVSSLHALAFARLTGSLEEFTLSAANLHGASILDTAGRPFYGNWSIIFRQVPGLQILSLGGSSGTESGGLDDSIWASVALLRHLRSLSLDYNKITTVPDFFLAQFVHLTFLSLGGNNIQRVTSATFYGKGGMQLYLHNNAISTMDNCTLAMYTNVTGILLSGNPFNCNCAMQWLWLRVNSDRQLTLPSMTCSQPAAQAGKSWSALTASDFCSPGEVPPNNCSVLTPPTAAPPTTPAFVYLLNITVSKVSDSSVSLDANVAKLAGQFAGYVVKYWPLSRPEAALNSSRLAMTTSSLTLPVSPNEVYRYCYLLLNDSNALLVENPANCRDYLLQGLASAAVIAIAVLAAIIGIALIFVVVCLLCKRFRRHSAALKAPPADEEDPYTYTYPDDNPDGGGGKSGGGRRQRRRKDKPPAGSQFQATLRPESKRFSKRSRNNLAGSRPSLATSTTTLAASRLSSPGFAVPNGAVPSRPSSGHSMAMQQQQQQQQNLHFVSGTGIQSSRSLHSIADDPVPVGMHNRHSHQQHQQQGHHRNQQQQQQLSRSQDHLGHQQRMLPAPPRNSQPPLRQAHSQELVLDVTRVPQQRYDDHRQRQPLPPSPSDYVPMSAATAGGGAYSGYADMATASTVGGGESSTDDPVGTQQMPQPQYAFNYNNDYLPDEQLQPNQRNQHQRQMQPATAQQLLAPPNGRVAGSSSSNGAGMEGVDNSAFRRNEASGYYEMGLF